MVKYSYNQDSLYIDGRWSKPSSNQKVSIVSPGTEEVIGQVSLATAADIDLAVGAARRAFDETSWARESMRARCELVDAFAGAIERRKEAFAALCADESGQPYAKNGLWQVDFTVRVYRYYAELGRKYAIEAPQQGLDGPFLLRREPTGVIGVITPWNAPLLISAFSIAPCIVAGCTMVLKPAPESPIHAQLLAEVANEIGLPAGVFNVVPADRDASEALVRHPGIDKINFTGSTATGRRIAAICGESLKRVSLELGGKSAAIVLEDADPAAIMPMLVYASMMNSGEACVGQTRILLPRSRYDEFAQAFIAGVSSMKMGDPHDAESDLGPLISQTQRGKVETYIKIGKEEGARVLLGGGRPANLARGWYVEPTVFGNVDNRMRIAQEEIFGPVACLIAYDDAQQAVEIANQTRYGLAGTVWTADTKKGIEIARQVRAGNFGVNLFNMDIAAPFGGFKESGIGRQLGVQGLDNLMEVKSIHLLPGTEVVTSA